MVDTTPYVSFWATSTFFRRVAVKPSYLDSPFPLDPSAMQSEGRNHQYPDTELVLNLF